MARFHYSDIQFAEEKDKIKGIFLKNFFFDMKKSELSKLGKYEVKNNDLMIEGNEAIVKRNFNTLLEQKLKELKSFQGKEAVYIYDGLIPLIGSLYFGIVDRNTNIIEIRPITGCNLNCIFCSVDLCKRERDFVVNVDFLAKEAEKLAKLKLEEVKELEIHINTQGEPLLYAPLAELIKKVSKIKGVKTISIDTNGSLLTEEKVDELVKAGMTRFNVSLNAFSEETAKKIAGTAYPLENVKKICKYIAKKCDILIAPVWLSGINDKDIEQLIKFSEELKKLRPQQKVPFIGIQNFLEYQYGKKPVKAIPFEEFFEKLKELEKKYKLKLKLSRDDFNIKAANVLKKPLENDEYTKVKLVCRGMFKNEMLGLAGDRIIAVRTDAKEGKIIGVKITRSKYNVFYGQEA
jgi:hypothetical protein